MSKWTRSVFLAKNEAHPRQQLYDYNIKETMMLPVNALASVAKRVGVGSNLINFCYLALTTFLFSS